MATVLIASMDGGAVSTLTGEIEGEGHEVLWAADGYEAQELAPRAALIFADPALPIFDGFELVGLLRGDPDLPRDLPILLLSDDAPEPHRFESSGFSGQFSKAHSYQDLRELLSVHLRDAMIA